MATQALACPRWSSAFTTPRISLVDLKTAVSACSATPLVLGVVHARYSCRTGLVGTVGGYYPSPTHLASRTRLLVLPGPNPCLGAVSAPTRALQGQCLAPPHTRAPRTQYMPLWANKGEIQVYIS